MIDSTSESLLVRLKSPENTGAWSQFAELYTPLIFYWARKNGLNSHDAADLVQEVMTLVFQKIPEFQYDSRRSFRGWLRKVTLNKHRERMRKKSLCIEDVGQSQLANVPQKRNGQSASSDLASQTWDQDYSKQLVSNAIDLMRREFAPKTWQALKLFVSTERGAADIAKEFGISAWTIYAAKSRLMKRLRQDLDGLLD